MRVYLCVGNQDLENIINQSSIQVTESDENLYKLYDMLDFIEADIIIINRLLDDNEGHMILKIAKDAKRKDIKIVILTEDLESYRERKVVTNLVNEDVTAFIKFEDFTVGKLEEVLKNYPQEFDFSAFSETKIEYKEVVKSVFKKVIAVYSPVSEGSSTIASHLAHALAENSQCRVCLLDFNILRPRVKSIFDMKFDYSLEKLLDESATRSLSSTSLEDYAKESKYIKGLDIFSGMENLNEIYQVNQEEFIDIIEKAKFIYDCVIIDTHSFYDLKPTHVSLRMADEVIVPIRGRNYSIETLNKYCENFEQYDDFKTSKFKVVVNKFSGDDLTSIEIQAKIKYPIVGYVSYSKDYDTINAFKNNKLISEYDTILRNLDIEVNSGKKFNFRSVVKSILKR